MSREIRRVALDWEHPRDGFYPSGEIRYVSLSDRSSYFRELEYAREHGEPAPDPSDYMPTWNEGTPLGWCLYETVSEGTPVSPVFKTEQEFEDWLISTQNMSRAGAKQFIEDGWAPSFMGVGGRILPGLQAIDHLASEARRAGA
ncbi:hypothetical protein [Glutamicibacter sp. V16R2B1]|uniref:hypothetical protein n=1 Tax=Glutamicibacter sp. V16R2B1 TaxID=2036207 RepID=UPI0010FDC370|nr:hypothetical protein [Glutamicibacter sp. V16R2B1]MCK9901337.1 hypothetical protein [Frankia sp. Cpl3]TLK47811.1 hypothetical protein FDN03_15625 [Glutamicibacter sp. V16R2B1]